MFRQNATPLKLIFLLDHRSTGVFVGNTSWWCAGWWGAGRSRAACQTQPPPPVPAGRTQTLAAGTSAAEQKPAAQIKKNLINLQCFKVNTDLDRRPLQFLSCDMKEEEGKLINKVPDKTALEDTGPSCLASGWPYCFAGCQWERGWESAARPLRSGSWTPGLASWLGALMAKRQTQTLWPNNAKTWDNYSFLWIFFTFSF